MGSGDPHLDLMPPQQVPYPLDHLPSPRIDFFFNHTNQNRLGLTGESWGKMTFYSMGWFHLILERPLDVFPYIQCVGDTCLVWQKWWCAGRAHQHPEASSEKMGKWRWEEPGNSFLSPPPPSSYLIEVTEGQEKWVLRATVSRGAFQFLSLSHCYRFYSSLLFNLTHFCDNE